MQTGNLLKSFKHSESSENSKGGWYRFSLSCYGNFAAIKKLISFSLCVQWRGYIEVIPGRLAFQMLHQSADHTFLRTISTFIDRNLTAYNVEKLYLV